MPSGESFVYTKSRCEFCKAVWCSGNHHKYTFRWERNRLYGWNENQSDRGTDRTQNPKHRIACNVSYQSSEHHHWGRCRRRYRWRLRSQNGNVTIRHKKSKIAKRSNELQSCFLFAEKSAIALTVLLYIANKIWDRMRPVSTRQKSQGCKHRDSLQPCILDFWFLWNCEKTRENGRKQEEIKDAKAR